MRATLFTLARSAASTAASPKAPSKPPTPSPPPSSSPSSKPIKKAASKPDVSTSNKPPPSKPSKPAVAVNKNSGLFKLYTLSPSLSGFLGVTESSRVETMKKVWVYIKENKLQSPEIKRTIVSDEKLKVLFGCDKFTITELPKLLTPHFVKE